ncbi:MAG: primosomal protein N' [Nitrospinae bacterium RIFCSPLOWO2_02_39_17]|nr:MAG: primosomal protein N' [Nitrospinae bacterium RIFCSPHIGHO2_02_39_11]OGW00363.1 MAG: primosomal protein N' [Nitrospinae bacterium RIFCSPHIGHO2_12_FULL_39_42]OGW05208.1 MAG: primosomal protein N' [Nitrospinae bacterium RIFCSPLOWO2_02_39_17]OGW08015.1 MAG: primosomal protein N' [Nitrospinae bacterium RIFCSPLOWO2_12_39_15]
MESFGKFAEVVFSIPLERVFLYRIPDRMESICKKGVRVFAPFGRRNRIGYVVGFKDRSEIETKELIEILDTEPVVTEEMLKFTKWVADYYFSSWGEVIESAMPPWVDVKIVNKKEIRRVKERSQKSEACGERSESIRSQKLVVSEANPSEVKAFDLPLTAYQEDALNKIKDRIEKGEHHVFLLCGVTGSGKTEVYMRSAMEVLKKGKKVIVIVPEITLTIQISERFQKFFGNRIALLHSGLTARERYREWMKVRSGEVDIVIGARSAVFAPLKDTGLIIVDEEHDSAYKQNENPRYNGRDIAIVRGKLCGAVAILGSATPSVESFYNCRIGKYEYVSLPERIDKKPLPTVEVVNIKGGKIISDRLKDEINKRIMRKEQTLLFLNRRGAANYIQCSECGFVWKCRNCSVSLTYHKKRNLGVCHYCEYSETVSDICPQCRGHIINFKGMGTQRLEEEVRGLFANSNIERMDRDTVRKRGEAGRILKGVEAGDVDILIGTQMIAKGHNYPRITLVGIISADDSLNIPDFRASERTFQLITQVAGRAGRGDIKGDVILQTYSPDNYAIKCAAVYDLTIFFNNEEKFREALNYPPYTKMVLFIIEGSKEERVAEFSYNFGEMLNKMMIGEGEVEKLGPSKAIIYKMRNKYRWHIILKSRKIQSLRKMVYKVMGEMKSSSMLKGGIKVDIDVDPLYLM